MKDDLKSAYNAGQRAYHNSATKIVTRLIPLEAIAVAAIARHYALSWLWTIVIIVAVVVIPSIVFIRRHP